MTQCWDYGVCLLSIPASATDPVQPPPAKPRAKTIPGSDGLRRLPGVVLFTAGRHRDMAGRTRDYPRDYLEGVVKTTQALRDDAEFHMEPPAVLGHEVVQAKLAEILAGDDTYRKVFADKKPSPGGGPGRTDQLAAGWPENLRLDGDRIVADLERIPPSVADLIDSGQLRYPSVEFQESAKRADGTPVPPHLFRLALLGGTPPGCKAVPPLGQAHFADLPAGVLAFADATGDLPAEAPPDKPMLALLQKCFPTLSSSFLGTLTSKQRDQLALDAAAMDGWGDQGNAVGDPHASLVAAYVKAGLGDQTAADKLTDDQLKQALSQAGVTSMADNLNPPVDPKAPKPAVPPELAAFADSLRAEFETHKKALDAQAEAIRKAAESAVTSQKTRADAEWAAAVDAFCDAQLKANKIAPWELDDKDPFNLRVRLKAIPADEVVVGFADANGNSPKMSRRKADLEAIEKRPDRSRMFGDRIGQPQTVPDERTQQKAAIAAWRKSQEPQAAARN